MPMDSGKHRSRKDLADDILKGEWDEKKLFMKHGATYLSIYKAVKHGIDLMRTPKAYTRRNTMKIGIWFGKSGSGKTHDAEQTVIDADLSMWKMPTRQLRDGWYDGYAGEQVILYDDFRGSSMKPDEFLNLMDGLERYPVKGGYVKNNATILLFTSPDHPINWWPEWMKKEPENNWEQIRRRIYDRQGMIYHADKHVITQIPDTDALLYKKDIETVKVF